VAGDDAPRGSGPPAGYAAVGITSALASAMGLPIIRASASAMLAF
jgi:hypothetical protein